MNNMETRSKFLEVEHHIKKQFHLVFLIEQKTLKNELRKKRDKCTEDNGKRVASNHFVRIQII